MAEQLVDNLVINSQSPVGQAVVPVACTERHVPVPWAEGSHPLVPTQADRRSRGGRQQREDPSSRPCICREIW